MVGPTLTLSIETRDAEIGARRMDQALRLVRTGAKATEDVVDKMADKLSRVGGSSALVTAIGRGVETSVQRARTALLDLERTADRTVSGIGRTISAERQAIDDVSGRLLGVGTVSSALFQFPGLDAIQASGSIVHANYRYPGPGAPNPFRDPLELMTGDGLSLLLRQISAINGLQTYFRSDRFSGEYTEIIDNMNNLLDSYLVNQGNISDLEFGEGMRVSIANDVLHQIMGMENIRGPAYEQAMDLRSHQISEWRRLVEQGDPLASDLSDEIRTQINGDIIGISRIHNDILSGLETITNIEQQSIEDPSATEYERELVPSLLVDIGRAEQVVAGWLDQLALYESELNEATGAVSAPTGVPDPPPPRPRRDPFGSFGAISPDLFVLDKAMLGDGIGIADIHENFPALEPVRVPLELDIAGLESLTDRQISDLLRAADQAMGDLQAGYDETLQALAASIVNRDGGRADSLATGLSDMTAISTGMLSHRIERILGGEADAFAQNLVEAWRRAYFEALVDNIGGSERQGAAADGTDLGFRDVGLSMLGGQLASSMVTADMLPVGGLAAIVPTPEEVELVIAMSEALQAQSGALDEGFTPATKGAAEATLELADAAVGLDAAWKAPDPAAMAEDMEELSALGQQVGNSFASAFERAIFSGEELSDVLSALALDLARLVLRESVLGPLAGGISAIIGGLFHAGGVVGQGGVSRPVSPLIFAGASRYHFGGLAGDEVPAILRRGEEVLTRDDPRHRANGGLGGGRAGGGVAIHQTISIDAKAVNENGVDGAAADAVGRQMRAAVRSAVQAEIAQQSRVGGMLNRV